MNKLEAIRVLESVMDFSMFTLTPDDLQLQPESVWGEWGIYLTSDPDAGMVGKLLTLPKPQVHYYEFLLENYLA